MTEAPPRFRSKLGEFESELRDMKAAGLSVRAIATELQRRHGLVVSHNAVASFMRTHHFARRSFLDGLSPVRREELLNQLKAIWTHDSTAIEGNTLTLGDTMFVLGYGLTVKGKPLKDQMDVQNHARAIDRVMEIFVHGSITEQDVFDLHRLVVNEQTNDIYKPVGAYKRENNGTYLIENGKSVYHAYLPADEVPAAMQVWIKQFNALFTANASAEAALEAFAIAHTTFAAIHPFYDGNGRLARLLANLPVLFAGHPPIVIPVESREDYIRCLWDYERGKTDLNPFKSLLRVWWQPTLDLVAEAVSLSQA